MALLIEVTEETIANWENGRGEPQLRLYPKLIDFLGYFPFEIDTSTLGGKIKEYRYKNGLSRKKLGVIIGVDASTIGGWEENEYRPSEKYLGKLNAYF